MCLVSCWPTDLSTGYWATTSRLMTSLGSLCVMVFLSFSPFTFSSDPEIFETTECIKIIFSRCDKEVFVPYIIERNEPDYDSRFLWVDGVKILTKYLSNNEIQLFLYILSCIKLYALAQSNADWIIIWNSGRPGIELSNIFLNLPPKLPRIKKTSPFCRRPPATARQWLHDSVR